MYDEQVPRVSYPTVSDTINDFRLSVGDSGRWTGTGYYTVINPYNLLVLGEVAEIQPIYEFRLGPQAKYIELNTWEDYDQMKYNALRVNQAPAWGWRCVT